jgi:hypothetical protein
LTPDTELLLEGNIVRRRQFLILSSKSDVLGGKTTVFGLKTLGNELMAMSSHLFRRRQPIIDPATLADFIDEQAAFLAQKGIYEYSRARAGHYAKILFAVQEFIDTVEKSRWRAFPIALAMVSELVEGVLRPLAGTEQNRQLSAIVQVALSVFDRYPVPAALGEATWRETRGELRRRLQSIGLHPVKRAFEIPDPFVKAYLDLMPIHKKLRASEFPTIHGYLKVTLCNVHEELTKRIDVPVVVASLREGGAGVQDARAP